MADSQPLRASRGRAASERVERRVRGPSRARKSLPPGGPQGVNAELSLTTSGGGQGPRLTGGSMKATQSGWRGLSSSSPCPSCLTPNFIFLISAMGLMPEEMREATCPRGSPQRVCEGSAGLTGARQPPAFPLRVRRRGTCLGRALRAGRAPALGSTIQAPWAGGAGGLSRHGARGPHCFLAARPSWPPSSCCVWLCAG